MLGNVELSLGCVMRGTAGDAGGIGVMLFSVCLEALAGDEQGQDAHRQASLLAPSHLSRTG